MIRKLIWTDSGLADLNRLKTFLSIKDIKAANRAAVLIEKSANHLLPYPFVGKMIKKLSNYREFYSRFGAGGYILRYRIADDFIYIMNIRHYREKNKLTKTEMENIVSPLN